MKEELIKSISKYIELSAEEERLIETFWTGKTLKKGDYLLRNGDTCRTDNFVVNGALKAFYINPETGKEEILYFAIENWWQRILKVFKSKNLRFTTLKPLPTPTCYKSVTILFKKC